MNLNIHDRICFQTEGMLASGTILAVSDKGYRVHDEIENHLYEDIQAEEISAKEEKVILVGLARIKDRFFGTFKVQDYFYHKILAPDLDSSFSEGIPDDTALCQHAWATGLIITPFMRQEYINLDLPDGPIIFDPQYDSMLMSLLKHGNHNQNMVYIDDELYDFLLSCCADTGLLPRDSLLLILETYIDDYYKKKKDVDEEVRIIAEDYVFINSEENL